MIVYRKACKRYYYELLPISLLVYTNKGVLYWDAYYNFSATLNRLSWYKL